MDIEALKAWSALLLGVGVILLLVILWIKARWSYSEGARKTYTTPQVQITDCPDGCSTAYNFSIGKGDPNSPGSSGSAARAIPQHQHTDFYEGQDEHIQVTGWPLQVTQPGRVEKDR